MDNPILRSFANRIQYGTPYAPGDTRVIGPVPFSFHDYLGETNPRVEHYSYRPSYG